VADRNVKKDTVPAPIHFAMGLPEHVGVALFLSLSLSLFYPLSASRCLYEYSIRVLSRSRLRNRDTIGDEGMKQAQGAESTEHHFRSPFRFRVAHDPLQGHDAESPSGTRRIARARASHARASMHARTRVRVPVDERHAAHTLRRSLA